ncbi:HEAT repeat domain-containing protein [Chondromyces crocatus]|uniref:PBS lyase n=1 Tax=Chondromyces crocatus TaxID=52 RepID=A0A0K1EDX1_CHOCO|nr:HEAT repeat domain-containing protein [Chondromyces crocatus]AKT39055.1 uncharacterized protein CMC5_032010 [Chondromyces crocatus]
MLRHRLIVIACVASLLGSASSSIAQDEALALKDLATDTDARVRVAAALALGKTKNPAGRAALESALKDGNASVRVAAAAALGTRGETSSLPALRAALQKEEVVNVRSQLDAAILRLSSKAPVRFLVSLGKLDNRSSVKDGRVINVLREETRAKAALIPGVELLAEGVDAAEVGQARKLPAFTLDGAVTHLAKGQAGGDFSYAAQVEFLIRKQPEQALKGSLAGSARALAEARSVRGPAQIDQLQRDAVSGAIESALRGATTALESAAGLGKR